MAKVNQADELTELENEYAANCEKFERMLRQHFTDNGGPVSLTPELELFMEQKLGLNKARRRDERSRIATVMRDEAVAGTPDQRKELERLLVEEEKTLPKRTGTLKKKIADLQKQLEAAYSKRDQLKTRFADVQRAVSSLRDNAPIHIRREYRKRRASLDNNGIGFEASEISAQLEGYRSYVAGPIGNDRVNEVEAKESFIRLVLVRNPEFVERVDIQKGGKTLIRYQLKEPMWSTFLATLPAEIERLSQEVNDATIAREAEQADIDKLRDYYLLPVSERKAILQ